MSDAIVPSWQDVAERWERATMDAERERDAALAKLAALEATEREAEILLRAMWGKGEPPYADAYGMLSQAIRLLTPEEPISRDEDSEKAGPVSAAEAREAVARFNASHWNNPGEHARYTIPADPKRDDDIRLNAYIRQSEQRIATLEAALHSVTPCVTRASSTCVYLRDGTKVVARRDPGARGKMWIDVLPQAVLKNARGDCPSANHLHVWSVDADGRLAEHSVLLGRIAALEAALRPFAIADVKADGVNTIHSHYLHADDFALARSTPEAGSQS